MGSEDRVKLTLTGKVSYSDEITLAQAAEILGFLSSGSVGGGTYIQGAAGGQGGGTDRRAQRQGAMSPKEALEASGAKTNPEKIAAFALLVSEQSSKETFTLEDVKPLFRQAREATPRNLNRDLDAAIRSGLVAEAENKGEYYVMDKALNVLASGFEGLRSGRSAGSRSRSGPPTRKPRKPLTVPVAFKGVEPSPVVDGLINYHKVKTKTDKYLWAVHAAKILGVEAVEPSDIAWLTDRLGEGISSNDLNSYYKGNQKQGYVNKNAEGKVRITPTGSERLIGLTAEGGK